MNASNIKPEIVDAGTRPPIFVRALTTPPAAPWRQRAIALLEARRSAPVPLPGLSVQLRRLRPWRPKKPGRYGAVYVRTNQIGSGFTTTANIDGVGFAVRFEPASQIRARASIVIALAAAAIVAMVLIGSAVMVAVGMRSTTSERLAAVDMRLNAGLRKARIETDRRRLSAALERVPDKGVPLADVLGDLAYAARSRQASVEVEAVHWRMAGMGVEVRGDGEPFAKGVARRVDKPLRAGVWLWIPATNTGGAQ